MVRDPLSAMYAEPLWQEPSMLIAELPKESSLCAQALHRGAFPERESLTEIIVESTQGLFQRCMCVCVCVYCIHIHTQVADP